MKLAWGHRTAIVCLAVAAFSAPARGQELERDGDLRHRAAITREQILRWNPVDPRALASSDPNMRWLAQQVAAGTTDLRVLRAYYRLYRKLAPFDQEPPADQRERALQARAKLEAMCALPANGTWFPLGPRTIPGRMTGLVLHPTDPNTVYAAGADGGVWKTTDLGATWAATGDFESTLATGAIAIDPVEPDTLYVGTGEGNYSGDSRAGLGIMKSSNGGSTWTLIPGSRFASAFHELKLDPRDRTQLWAASTAGLFRSRDSGQTWSPAGGGLPAQDATSVVISVGTPGVLLAGINGAAAGTGLWRTTDGGVSWALVPSFPAGGDNARLVLAQSAANPQRIWAALASSTNGGVKGVYRSSDEGATWVAVASPGQICSSYCWYCLTIGADPVNPDLAYVGGVGIRRTEDGGQTWVRAANSGADSYVHVDQHQFLTPAAEVMWSANDGGINVTGNRGVNWDLPGFALETAQYYHLSTDPGDDNWAVAGAQDNGSQRFSGSWSWDSIYGGDGAFTAINSRDSRIWYASSQFLSMARSRNRGSGMVDIGAGIDSNDPRAFIAPFALDRSNPDTVFAGTDKLYRSLDQGDNFSALSPALGGVVSAIDNCRDVGASIWVGTSTGRLWNTQNGGGNWQDRSAGLPGRFVSGIAAHPNLPGTAFVSVAGSGAGHIWKTTNAGLNWSNVSTGLPDIDFNHVIVLEDTPDVVVAAAEIGVYVSTDAGASWAVLGSGLPNSSVYWLAYAPGTGTLRAATHGRGAWQLTLPSTCPLGPDFRGLDSATVSPATGCVPELAWSAAGSSCAFAPAISYAVYRSTDPLFTPGPATLLGAGLVGLSYRDTSALPGIIYYYVVRAEDGQTGQGGPANGGRMDANTVALKAVMGDPWASGTFNDDGGDSKAWMSSSGQWSIGDDANTTPAGRFGWQSTPRGSSFHGADVCEGIETPDLRLGATPTPTLSYQASYNLEHEWDGVVVEISADGGQNWSDLPPAVGYPGSLAQTQGNACGFGPTRATFTGPASNAGRTAFAGFTSSLSAWAGQSVRIRFRLSSDGGLEYEGFRLDDVAIGPVSSPSAPAVGNVLKGVKLAGGGSAARFSWSDLAGIAWYRLYGSSARDQSARTLAGEGASGAAGIDELTPRPRAVHYFRLHTAPACGIEGP